MQQLFDLATRLPPYRAQTEMEDTTVNMHDDNVQSVVRQLRVIALLLTLAFPVAFSQARPEAEPNTQIIFAVPDQTHNLLPLQGRYDDMPADMKDLVRTATGSGSFSCPASKQALLLHFATWRQNADSSFALISNEWYVYHVHRESGGKCSVVQAGLKANGDQSLYQDTDAIVIGFTKFQTTSGTPAAVAATITYKASATAQVAENIQDLGALISAVTGVSTNAGKATPPSSATFVAAQTIAGYRKNGRTSLPFIFNLSYSVGLPAPQSGDQTQPNPAAPAAGAPAAGGGAKPANGGNQNVVVNGGGQTANGGQQVTDCTGLTPSKSPCSSSKTFRSDDPEVWDVSVGISVPGVPELVYGSDLTAKPTTKWHTDFYGFFDIYPFAKLVSKESPVPHFLAGVPLTSQPLHRSSYGVAENITSWTGLEKHGFPLRINVYAAVAVEKVNYLRDSTGTLSLKPGWTLKPNFGIEVPISSILSKLGSKSKSSSSKGSGN
jgi:hypothetical protein